MSKIKYGYYSRLHAEQLFRNREPLFEYKTPDGKVVIVTAVLETKDSSIYAWTDKKFVAEVVEFVRFM